MEGEPPLKRARRTDSAAMWDDDGASTATSLRSSKLSDGPRRRQDEAAHHGARGEMRNGSNHNPGRREGERRRPSRSRSRSRSRSPREEKRPSRDDDRKSNRNRHERRRSRSPLRGTDKDKGYRDREPARDRDRERERDRKRDQEPGDRDSRRQDRERERMKERSRSRSRDRDRRHDHGRDVKGSRDTARKRTRSRSPNTVPANSARETPPVRAHQGQSQATTARKDESKPRLTNGSSKPNRSDVGSASMDVDEDGVDVIMKRMMGFTSFRSTQNTKVPGNQIYGVRKEKKTEYRQYMNRVGGFNRPLSPGR